MDTLFLTNTDIDRVSEQVAGFLTKAGNDSRNTVRMRLMIEEVLIRYQKEFGADTAISLKRVRRFFRESLVLSVEGRSCNPFSETDEQEILHRLLADAGIAPGWYYINGKNTIELYADQKRKISGLAWIGISLVLGFGLGFLSRLLPDSLVHTVADGILAPLSDTMMSFLSGMAVLLIFFSVITGICGMGDMSTFQRVGKKMIGKLMLSLAIYTLVVFAVLTPFFPVAKEGVAGIDGKELYTMLLDIVPGNAIEPFATGNTMQVIFLAICIGAAMLVLSLKVSGVLSLFTQLTDLVQRIVMAVIQLLPVVVFISIFRMVALRQLSAISTVYRYPLLLLLTDSVLLLIGLLRVALTKKVSPRLLVKKLLPTAAIAAATASSVAAFTSNVETCQNKLGIRKDLTDVGIPLGQVIYMPGSVADVVCTTLCMAYIYGTSVTFSRLVMLALITFILTIAAPPMPGSGISCYMLTMAQFGIPAEAIAVILAFNVLIDRITTPSNVALLQLEMVQVAGSLNLLDQEVLQS